MDRTLHFPAGPPVELSSLPADRLETTLSPLCPLCGESTAIAGHVLDHCDVCDEPCCQSTMRTIRQGRWDARDACPECFANWEDREP